MSNDKDFIVNGPVVVGKDTKVTVGTITASDIDLSTGNYFAEALTADTTYTISNAGAVQAFQLEVTGGAVGYDIASAVYDNVSFSVNAQDGVPTGIRFKPDGTKLYLVGRGFDYVYQYSLSVAYDLSTISYDSVGLFVGSQDVLPTDLEFSNDGTKMYVIGYANDAIHQYPLSTPWDLSTADRFASISFSVLGQSGIGYGITFNNDGTKMYMLGSSTVFQYSLSTAFDISTASYDSISFSTITQDAVYAFFFKPDGTKMYAAGNNSDSIYQYSLSTAYDISTLSYDNISFSVTTQDTFPISVVFDSVGEKMYILGNTNNTIYQYSGLSTDATLTWPTSIEWAGGVTPFSPANGETDVLTFITDDSGTTYTGVKSIDNAS